jgi:hypothetical protein
MDLNDVLEFVRNTDRNVWNPLIAEMKETRKRRDLEAAENFSIGDLVVFQTPRPEDCRKGRIIKIARGRVSLAVRQGTGFFAVGVPARMVRHCHDAGVCADTAEIQIHSPHVSLE